MLAQRPRTWQPPSRARTQQAVSGACLIARAAALGACVWSLRTAHVHDGHPSSAFTPFLTSAFGPPISASELQLKARLRWSPELHARFETSVNALGGMDKATPKVRWRHSDGMPARAVC